MHSTGTMNITERSCVIYDSIEEQIDYELDNGPLKKGVGMKKTKKPTSKDYEKIISIQERIINVKESEFKQIEKLFLHYLDKYETYALVLKI